MASTFNSIAALVSDDTGTPEAPNGDGTQINSSLFAAIDAILNEFLTRSSKTIGGVLTWETPGVHTWSGSSTGANELLVRNTNNGTSAVARLRLGNNASDSVGELWVTSSTASEPNTLRLNSAGAGGIRLSVGATAPIQFSGAGGGFSLPGNIHDTLAIAGFNIVTTTIFHNNAGQGLGDNTGFLIGENINTWNTSTGASYGTQANNTLPSWALDLGGARGNDGAPWATDNFSILRRPPAGSWTRMLNLGVQGGTFPQLHVGRSTFGTPGGVQIGEGAGTPIAGQILFGGDGSGWGLRLGRNNGGTITHYWNLSDSGHLTPVTDAVYNMGGVGSRIGTVTTVNVIANNIGATAYTVGNGGIIPLADNNAALGASGFRFSAIFALDSNFGDVSFDNQWSITEGEKVGLGHGLAFVRNDQELCMFIDERGTLFVNETKPLIDIRRYYKKMTKQERLSAS